MFLCVCLYDSPNVHSTTPVLICNIHFLQYVLCAVIVALHIIQYFVDILGRVKHVVGALVDEGLLQEFRVLGPLRLVLLQAQVDKVDKLFRKLIAVVGDRTIGELGRAAVHHLRQLLKHRVPLGIGKFAGGQLDQRDAQRPHVRPDVVAFGAGRVDALGRHVRPTAGVPGLGNAVDQLARDAKVAQLDGARLVQQDVARLHVPVDDAEFLLKVGEGFHGGQGHLADEGLWQRI